MRSTDDYLKIFKNYKRLCSNKVSEICTYNWDDSLCRSEIKKIYELLIKEFKDVDFLQFTIDELKELDFRWWDENLLCTPLWVMDCLKEGTILTSIDETESVFSKGKLDSDTRMGVTAYGFTRSQLRDKALDKLLEE